MTTATAPQTTRSIASREEWLHRALDAFRPFFAEYGYELPQTVYVSVGIPKGRSTVIGQCWYTTEDGNPTIFVSPVLTDARRVLDVLLHEAIHAALPGHGHRGDFPKAMRAFGLEGKPTATVAGFLLGEALDALARELGEYAHAGLDAHGTGIIRGKGKLPKGPAHGPKARPEGAPKKQGTRMRKMECRECGYIARTTAKWLDLYGATICPCNGQVMSTPEA